jgi:Protein of unknown function DUF262
MSWFTGNTTFYSDPHIQFLAQILQDIGRGELLVPRFQRPFVWLEEQQLELLRSIRQGIPIGSVMVWRTSNRRVACYRSLGPYQLETAAASGVRDYLLDGVQRLSTLYGALHRPSRTESLETEDVYVPLHACFDLRKRDFIFLDREPDEDDPSLPLSILLDSVALLRYQRGLASKHDGDSLVEESDRLAAAFRQYKVPIIPIATEDLGLATLTFQRINSQGQKMSDYHMLHALTWSENFDLMNRIENLRADWLAPIGWGDLDEDIILKVTKLKLGLDAYKADIQELSRALVANHTILDEAIECIVAAATFLRAELHIPTPEFVPYSLQIVLLAFAFGRSQRLDDDQLSLVTNWFWFITYTEAFTGISDDRVRVAVDDLMSTLDTRKAIWRNKSSYSQIAPRARYDFRAVRSKSFILCLARELDKKDDELLGTTLLREYGRRAIQHLIPTSAFPAAQRKIASQPGNKMLAAPAGAASAVQGDAIRAQIEHQFLGYQHESNWSDPVQFVQQREQLLFRTEAQFADQTAGAFWRDVLAQQFA